MLGRHNEFVCRECRRKKPGNYFISESLCKRCAAKRRGKPYNPVEVVVDGIHITQYARKRLEKQARKQIPKTIRDYLAGPSFLFVTIVSWFLGVRFGTAL